MSERKYAVRVAEYEAAKGKRCVITFSNDSAKHLSISAAQHTIKHGQEDDGCTLSPAHPTQVRWSDQ